MGSIAERINLKRGVFSLDNFLSTIVFLLPGVLAYFWLQAFGINPVLKHSTTEFVAVAALLWFPVAFSTLLLYNGAIALTYFISESGIKQIWTMQDLYNASVNFAFLATFLALSIFTSFMFSQIWARWGYKKQQAVINYVRKRRGLAAFSKSTSVWDEIFAENEAQVIEYGKIDKPENSLIGCIRKASRPFEPERHIAIDDVDYFTDLVSKHKIPVANILLDAKSGVYIKVFDSRAIADAQLTSSPEE